MFTVLNLHENFASFVQNRSKFWATFIESLLYVVPQFCQKLSKFLLDFSQFLLNFLKFSKFVENFLKTVYIWVGLQTYTAPSAYSLCMVHHKPKFVSFLCRHEKNRVCRVDKFFHIRKLHPCCVCFLHFFFFFNMDWSLFIECALKLWFIVCSPRVHRKLIYCAPSA